MSSKRAVRRKSCKGKRRYESMPAAHTACIRLLRVQPVGTHMSAYHCRFCGGFHFGHTPARVLRARQGA